MAKSYKRLYGLILVIILATVIYLYMYPMYANQGPEDKLDSISLCPVSVSELTAVFSDKGLDIYEQATYETDNVKKIKYADFAAIKKELASLKAKCLGDEKITMLADIYYLLADELKQRKLLLIKLAEINLAMEEEPCNALDYKDDYMILLAGLNTTVSLKEDKLKQFYNKFSSDPEISSLELANLGNSKEFSLENLNSVNESFANLEEVCSI